MRKSPNRRLTLSSANPVRAAFRSSTNKSAASRMSSACCTKRLVRVIVDEVRAAIDDETSDPLSRDARLVAGCRRAVHYEIASYRTLRDWGRSLGMTRALPLFEQTLVEDCDADLTMASLAAAKPCPMQPPGHP
jgi:ferritin-like metal-binding protein YciE